MPTEIPGNASRLLWLVRSDYLPLASSLSMPIPWDINCQGLEEFFVFECIIPVSSAKSI